MTIAQQIQGALAAPEMIVNAYLEDLTDEDLMLRPAPGMNHLNWQIGHLLEATYNMVEAVSPGSMPELPAGLSEKYSRDQVENDDPTTFLTKAELMEIKEQQKQAISALLDKISDEELMQPAPEKWQMLGPTVGTILQMTGTHWVMHAGQWVAVRRQLGKKALF